MRGEGAQRKHDPTNVNISQTGERRVIHLELTLGTRDAVRLVFGVNASPTQNN